MGKIEGLSRFHETVDQPCLVGQISYERGISLELSGSAGYYTNSSTVQVENMLCSDNH